MKRVMMMKSEYEELIIAIHNRCNDLGFQPDPTTVTMNFDQVAVNAATNTMHPHVHIQGCFYHLTQSTWRQIQSMGLVAMYCASEKTGSQSLQTDSDLLKNLSIHLDSLHMKYNVPAVLIDTALF